MTEQIITDFVENLEDYCGRKRFNKRMQEIQQMLLDRDLEELNRSLLKPLRLKQEHPKIMSHLPFPELYFQNTQKTYTKDSRLPSNPQLTPPPHSPFVPQKDNFSDTNANSKLLRDRHLFTLGETSANLSHLLTNLKNPKFLGESKATYPTIILEGKEKHPMGGFPNGGTMGEGDFRRTLGELGGISDSLKRVGLESVYEKNRRTFEENYKTFSGFMTKTMSMSNTNNFVIEPPKLEVKVEIKNPFVRVPKKFE